MAVYHQMGHDSQNLLCEGDLQSYRGAILSPVNHQENRVRSLIAEHGSEQFEMIFDPQLYYPRSVRGQLPEWSYFPQDVDTTDLTSENWWRAVVRRLADTMRRVGPMAVCSPAVVPQVYSDDYYSLNRDVASELQRELHSASIGVVQTLIASLADLSQPTRPAEISSIVSGGVSERVFLVLRSTVEPRRELHDTDQLKGAMRLIRFLEQAGMHIIVGFSSSDLVLWKAAGASDCATGKFFNLRRFTPSRFVPPQEGGGQVPYWFEEALMGYIRESDLVRARRANLLSQGSLDNPYGQQILDLMDNQPGTPWLRLSWRQHMYWFADFESRLSTNRLIPDRVLSAAEQRWLQLLRDNILMEEMQNDGTWLRAWRRAILEAFPA